ncbi:hypothetical protein DESUT3_14980 [Desulfuromonas versatilis]|uniref:Ice-binding protein C-terminal domain-containing protein n=2 Tax=Desulfuromonas versatilis TaxID=2802975 RepID=A0ABM8HUT3_9BACT|nr:hypothetical protein DESUT3_14980 [Desulfuromonas versatilis]
MRNFLVSVFAAVVMLVGGVVTAEAVFIQQNFGGLVGGVNAGSVLDGILSTTSFINGSAIYDRDLISDFGPSEQVYTGGDLTNFSFSFQGLGSFAAADDIFFDGFSFLPPSLSFDIFPQDDDGTLGPDEDPLVPPIGRLKGFSFLTEFTFNSSLLELTVFDKLWTISEIDSFGFLTDIAFGEFFLPDFGFDLKNAPPVPEPSTILLLGAGLGGLVYLRRRQGKS